MTIIVVGVSHKTCQVKDREHFYFDADERQTFLARLKRLADVQEALIISTCNRTELYTVMSNPNEDLLIDQLCEFKGQPATSQTRSYFYRYHDQKAVRHLLSVSAGLDSLVIGEKEISGQIKGAIDLSRRFNFLGRHLNILTNITLRTGKLVRLKTDINKGGLSVSWAAVEHAKKYFQTLSGRTVLILGAGKMSHLAASDFKRKGVKQLFVMNRTQEKSQLLADKFEAETVEFGQLKDILKHVDVCICSTGAGSYLIDKPLIEYCMSGRSKELLLIDISMPRNIDPAVKDVDNVSLIGLDELDRVVHVNRQQRLSAVYEAQKIITQKEKEFYKKLHTSLLLTI